MENKTKKLTLNQETLRNLTQEDLRNVVGGFGNTQTCSCHPATVCCPTFTCVVPAR